MESEEGLGNTSRLVCRHRAWTRPEYVGESSTQERAVRAGGAAASGAHASAGPLLCPGVMTSIKLLKRRTEMGPPSLNHDLNLTGQN